MTTKAHNSRTGDGVGVPVSPRSLAKFGHTLDGLFVSLRLLTTPALIVALSAGSDAAPLPRFVTLADARLRYTAYTILTFARCGVCLRVNK